MIRLISFVTNIKEYKRRLRFTLIAVRMRRFCKFLFSENTEFSNTIFSNNSINSFGRSAVMKALTVMETSSGSRVSGRAV
jgi:hypothetical protein